MKRIQPLMLWLFPSRAWVVVFVSVALVALICCFLPLVNLLGYESAAVFGVIGGLLATFLTIYAIRAGQVEAPLSEHRDTSPAADFLKLLVRQELILVLPALILSLNALRIINCAYGVGVGFWLLIPVPAILLGQLLGWGASALFKGRLGLQITLVILAILSSVAAILAQLALQPPIVGHQLFLGYFSGSIYDEALSLPVSLMWYRGMGVALSVAILALIEARWRARRNYPVQWAYLVGVIALIGFSSMWVNRQHFGVEITDEFVQKELGGRLETEHFIIYYPQTRWFIEHREELAEDHEFRYAQMREFFEIDPVFGAESFNDASFKVGASQKQKNKAKNNKKLKSYVYADQEQKGRLMGGRRTLVSKLWLHEMHILWQQYGDHRLAHELAHIFSEPMGAGPLKLSMQAGVGVNMGLVEGIATAADWPINEFSPHEASAALRRMNLAPDVSGIVSASGFWTQSSGRAYILVGSFVRFLIDHYGIDAFKQAYPHGKFERAYQKSTRELIEQWEAFVDAIPLNEEEMAIAAYLYDRPTIFEKVCARQIGDLMVEANVAAQRGDVGEVRDIYEEILSFDPQNMQYRLGYAHALSQAHEYDEALEQVEGMLKNAPDPVFNAQLLSLRGDLAWRRAHTGESGAQQQLREAEDAYRQCLELGVPSDNRRALLVKLAAIGRPAEAGRDLGFEYLLGDISSDAALYYPMRWYMNEPEDYLAAYLLGRRLWSAERWAEAIDYLEEALAAAQEDLLVDELRWMLGQSHYFMADFERAARYFEVLQGSERPSYRARASQWLARIAWKQGNRIGDRPGYQPDHTR